MIWPNFRLARLIKADDGENGGKSRRSGRSGDDVIVDLPCGTLIKEAESGRLLADLTEPGQSFVCRSRRRRGFRQRPFQILAPPGTPAGGKRPSR